MTKAKDIFSFPQVVEMVGQPYDKVRHVVIYQRIVEPRRYGCSRLFDREQIETLKQHFAKQEEGNEDA